MRCHHFIDACIEQPPVCGEDTDAICLHCCNLNTKFDFTVPSLQFLRLNVVFGHFIFVSSLVERRISKLICYRLTGEFWITRRCEISIHCTAYWKSSNESSVFFFWAKESFSLWNCSSRNSTLFSSWRRALGLFWNATKAILRYIFSFFTLWSRKLRC